MDGSGWGEQGFGNRWALRLRRGGLGGGGGGLEKLELLQSCELKHSHTPASFTVLMHQDVTKMCQIFKKPHTYTNASPCLCRPPKLRPSVSWGWEGSGAWQSVPSLWIPPTLGLDQEPGPEMALG